MKKLLQEIRACTICAEHLPLGPKPIVQLHSKATVLIAGQAPGVRAHESGIPWNDPSGDRLRDWLGVTREQFYDERCFALLPAGFCYPGTGRSGDLPPRPECVATWHERVMRELKSIQLVVLAGTYSQAWLLGPDRAGTLTETVRDWKRYFRKKNGQRILPLPHPSPRNQLWMKKNPWFAAEVLPALRKEVRAALRD